MTCSAWLSGKEIPGYARPLWSVPCSAIVCTAICMRDAARESWLYPNGGTIPDTALFAVIAQPEGVQIGTLDEDFAVESSAGDIILLAIQAGGSSGLRTRVASSWRMRMAAAIVPSLAGRGAAADA